MWFFVFSINFAQTREGRPAHEKTYRTSCEVEKILSPIPPPSFLFFKSIFHVRLRLLSFTSSMLHLVWSRERNDKTLTPTPKGIFLLTASDWEFCATLAGTPVLDWSDWPKYRVGELSAAWLTARLVGFSCIISWLTSCCRAGNFCIVLGW